MANIDELLRLDVEIRVAERNALVGVAEYLRDAVRALPSESKLGLIFVRRASQLEACARESTPTLGADFYLRGLREDADGLDDSDGGDV